MAAGSREAAAPWLAVEVRAEAAREARGGRRQDPAERSSGHGSYVSVEEVGRRRPAPAVEKTLARRERSGAAREIGRAHV